MLRGLPTSLVLSAGLAACIAAGIAACKGQPYEAEWCSEADTGQVSQADAPTWVEIGPLFAQKCGACHVPGGHAPFAVAEYADVVPYLGAIRDAVTARTMPPWLAADCCQSWFQDFSLTPTEIAAVQDWVDAGAPEGAGIGAPLEPIGGLSRVDVTLTMPEPYEPPVGDSIRCFVFDWPESSRRYVTGLAPQPGNRAEVHHLIVSMVAPDDADEVDEADAADPEAGFDCTGGLGDLPSPVLLGGSLLGGDYPRGIGNPVEPGSRILLQVHYSVDTVSLPDATSVQFRVDDTTAAVVEAGGIAISNPGWLVGTGMAIPAGEEDVAYYYRFRPSIYTGGVDVDLQGVTPHMHRYASKMRVLALHADGTSDCLLEIPDWEFGWEQPYWFANPVPLSAQDELYLECHFDNSAANQPTGEPPRDIAWGDSDQDMCAAFLSFTKSAP
jgi:hypothetical protein